MREFLRQILAAKREEVRSRAAALPLARLRERPAPVPRDFVAALAAPGLSLIAEIKRRSPSRGVLRDPLDPAALAVDYAAHGAAALSVLTDGPCFGGSFDDLGAARAACALPVLRKDFLVEPYQLEESRAFGADAVLLIARLLDGALLGELVALTHALGLAALVEVHDDAELGRALAAGARVLGVNARDLDTFELDCDLHRRLRGAIPGGCLAVAESGIRSPEDARRLARSGYDALLVGEELVRAAAPGARLAELLAGVLR